MRRVRSLPLWSGVPAVLVGVAIGVLTNIVTSTPTWPVVAGLVAAVAVQVGLTVWQANRDKQKRFATIKAARAKVLTPLQPQLLGAHTISTLLAAEHALAPFRARQAEMRALLHWCLDMAAPPLRVLAGPGGVGKSRLAVELAARLPEGWVSGRCVGGRVRDLLPAVLACPEPTLVVVDDADTEPDVAALIEQLGEREDRGQLKVLLVVRNANVFEHWVQQQLPDGHRGHLPTVTLRAVGEANDRRRWFAEAVRAYAAALGTAPPSVSDMDKRPVGIDGEAMVVTQARAALAAVTGTRERTDTIRTASLDRVCAELLEHERQRWNRAAEDPRWGLPRNITAEAREQALLALALLAPATPAEASLVLRLLPRFRAETDESLRRNIVAWAHHLYPGLGATQVQPSPDFLHSVLLAALASPAQTEIADSLMPALSTPQGPDAITRLIRAAALFGSVAPLVGKVVHNHPDLVGATIECLALTEPSALSVEGHLLVAIAPDLFGANEISRLLDLLEPTGFHHLRAVLREWAVHYARDFLSKDDTDDARVAVAESLDGFGVSLWELGRYHDAVAALEEALGLWQGLAKQQPTRHTPRLAHSLNNLGINLRELGRYQDALAADEEAVVLWRSLAAQELASHTPKLARSLDELGVSLWKLRRYQDALTRFEEALGLWRDLAAQQPTQHTADLARSLRGLGVSQAELGRYQDALVALEEALGLWRVLAVHEPASHLPDLARLLDNLGVSLSKLEQPQDAVAALEEAVGLWRGLAKQQPHRHTSDLVRSLDNLAVSLWELGRYQDALIATEEAVGLGRGLAKQQPTRYTPDLARSLNQLGASLWKLRRYQDALTRFEEALGLWRDLAAQYPSRYTVDLARSLHGLAASLWELRRPQDALTRSEEALGLWRDLAAQDPAVHTLNLMEPLINQATMLCQLGLHDEELDLRTEVAVRWRILAQLKPDEYEEAYQGARYRLASSYSEHGHEPSAAWRTEENLVRRLKFRPTATQATT